MNVPALYRLDLETDMLVACARSMIQADSQVLLALDDGLLNASPVSFLMGLNTLALPLSPSNRRPVETLIQAIDLTLDLSVRDRSRWSELDVLAGTLGGVLGQQAKTPGGYGELGRNAQSGDLLLLWLVRHAFQEGQALVMFFEVQRPRGAAVLPDWQVPLEALPLRPRRWVKSL